MEMITQTNSNGRIDIAPEVLMTVALHAIQDVKGVAKLVSVPSGVGRKVSRSLRQDGLLLDLSEDKLIFEVYIDVTPTASLVETSRAVQVAVSETVQQIIGVTVTAVNVHVEDVIYTSHPKTEA